MLLQRILSTVILLPIVLWATVAGGNWFSLLVGVAALLAAYEFYRLVVIYGHFPSFSIGLTLTALLLLDGYYPGLAIARCSVVAAVGLLMVEQVFRGNRPGALASWGLTLSGALYVGGMGSHLILARNLPQGLQWVLLTFAVAWSSDSAAYFFGSRWGRRKLAPQISPNKTWEGALAGLLFGIAASIIVGHALLGLDALTGLMLGALLTVAAVFGDLAKSLIKRQAGVKDSGNLIPGHGGMLDRIDSLLFAGVVTYYYALWAVLK